MESSLENRLKAATRRQHALVPKYRELYRKRKKFNKVSFNLKLSEIRTQLDNLLPNESTLTAEHRCILNPTASTQKAMRNFIAAAEQITHWHNKCSDHLERLIMQDGPDHSGWFWLIPVIFMVLVLVMYLAR